MVRPYLAPISLVVLCFLLNACATFEPSMRYPDLLRVREATVKHEQEGLTVSIEEFASPRKSLQAFDADLAAHGVLPLLVRIDNNSVVDYHVRQIDIDVKLNGAPLTALYGDQAADRAATSEYAGKALGWTLATGPLFVLFWPATIAGSAAHTAGVNKRVRQHFASMELSDSLLKPKQSVAGFVYFKLHQKTARMEGLTVAIRPRNNTSGKILDFLLTLPVLDLSQPADTAAN